MPDVASSSPERTLGKYVIVKPLKIGGTAAIYLAIMRGENNFSREVVIKRPLPHLVADRRSRLMFLDEAHIAARLSHPNICQVLDLVAREDEVYLVLEYLRGVDVREILKRCIQLGRLVPPEVAVWIAIEVAAGLDSAHAALGLDGKPLNLVHRDVSPKNVRVTYAGAVKVIDFGIARAMNRATETAAGTIKGTLGYMSPEQILGDEIDRRSDIFAFGICLFQMLTSRNPFDGPTLKERVRKLTLAPIPSVREFNPALDGEIADIVARCLDRDIDVRYGRMGEVQVELDRYLARLQVVSPRQRLINFLQEIFPDHAEEDTALKSALSELSQVTSRIDTEQRLRFPDDPETDAEPRAASAASASATAGTEADGPSERPTNAEETERDAYDANDTRPAVTRRPVGPNEPRLLAPIETSATDVADAPKPPRPTSWVRLALVAAAICAAAAVAAAWVLKTPEVPIIVTSPPETALGPPDAAVAEAPSKSPPGARVAVDPTPRPAPPPAPASKTPRPRARVKPRTPRRAPPAADRDRAKRLFRTARRMEKKGDDQSAELLYQLAYAFSGRRKDPAIYLNLGRMYNKQDRIPKAKACLTGFLKRAPGAGAAPVVETILSTYPPVVTVNCVSEHDVRAARRQYQRRGAEIDSWLDETLKNALK